MAAVIRNVLQPWAGVLGGAAGWYVSQQAGANMVFSQCAAGHWWSVGLIGLFGLALIAAGGLLSWQAWRGGREGRGGRQLIALLGMMVAAVLAFPVLMQTIAGLFVPGCGS